MSYYMWLFSIKKLDISYSGTVARYRKLSDEEKLKLYQEFCERS